MLNLGDFLFRGNLLLCYISIFETSNTTFSGNVTKGISSANILSADTRIVMEFWKKKLCKYQAQLLWESFIIQHSTENNYQQICS
jgi:hypothetical protein